MSKFKVGDKVRIVRQDGHSKTFPQAALKIGEEFEVTSVRNGHDGDQYARGDSVNSGVWFENLELVKEGPKFKIGDKVKVSRSGRTFTIGKINRGFMSGRQITWEVNDHGVAIGNGHYFDEIEHVEERPFREGDLIRAEKGDSVITGRLYKNIFTGMGIESLGWPIESLKRDEFTITLVEAAPEPEPVDEFPLPTEPGLYISQAFVVFRLGEDGNWIEARKPGLIDKVKPDTLKSEKHWPLGLIAEPESK